MRPTTSLAGNPSTDVGQEIWDSWTGLWNGTGGPDPAVFIADDVTVHLPTFGMPPSASLTTRDDVTGWIEGFRSCYRPGARFAAELGPWLVGDEFVVARWRFTGEWQGGVPATATAAMRHRGVDLRRRHPADRGPAHRRVLAHRRPTRPVRPARRDDPGGSPVPMSEQDIVADTRQESSNAIAALSRAPS